MIDRNRALDISNDVDCFLKELCARYPEYAILVVVADLDDGNVFVTTPVVAETTAVLLRAAANQMLNTPIDLSDNDEVS